MIERPHYTNDQNGAALMKIGGCSVDTLSAADLVVPSAVKRGSRSKHEQIFSVAFIFPR